MNKYSQTTALSLAVNTTCPVCQAGPEEVCVFKQPSRELWHYGRFFMAGWNLGKSTEKSDDSMT